MTYKEELINSIEADFVFSKKPINRFKISETNIDKDEQINQLKKLSQNKIEIYLILGQFHFTFFLVGLHREFIKLLFNTRFL